MSLLDRIMVFKDPARIAGGDLTANPPIEPSEAKAISLYLRSDRIPHVSPGYSKYKERLVLEILADPELMAAFQDGAPMPAGFGARLDERVVEYPWIFSRLPKKGNIFDAGSTLNKEVLIQSDYLRDRELIIYTLWIDRIALYPKVSFLLGDLRDIILRDNTIDTLVCISTLEHVGYTYDYKTYSKSNPWPHAQPESYLDAVREFWRITKPGGHFLLTIPFGKYERHGWLQQFDSKMIDAIEAAFPGKRHRRQFYRYVDGAWCVATEAECVNLEYFNIHETGKFDPDGAAAARGVCCLDLEKVAS
jgi:SAM-dependent methyltransferase